jgi:hypothetical protein
MTERRVPGPTPAGGAYGIVRYLDAEGQPAAAAEAVTLQFDEYDAEGNLIASTSGALGGEGESADG